MHPRSIPGATPTPWLLVCDGNNWLLVTLIPWWFFVGKCWYLGTILLPRLCATEIPEVIKSLLLWPKLYRFLLASLPKRWSWKTIRPIIWFPNPSSLGHHFWKDALTQTISSQNWWFDYKSISPAPPFHFNLPNPSFHVNKWSIRQSLAVKTTHLYEYLSGNFPILYKLGRFQFPKNHPLH